MNRLVLGAIFVGVFAAGLVASMPLGVALAWTGAGESGLSASAVSGSIWNGRIEDMRLRGFRFGTVEARLDPFGLLTGTSRVHLQSRDGEAVLVKGRSEGLDGADAIVDLAALVLAMPVEGVVRLQGATVLFETGRCSKAAGHLVADIAHGKWKGPRLAGELVCDGALAVAKLSGSGAGAEVTLAFSVDANARYILQSRVTSSNSALRLALSLAGFEEGEGGMQRSDQGRLGT